ncbi:MAG: cupredoxin domain-containing protein [Patescibacteria group bacterium]
MKKILTFIAIFAVALTLSGAPSEAFALTSITKIQAGDLVRGESFSAVYYVGRDGFRYVFPNDKTYATWYSNFDTVKWLSDADLATIQIGGNVTYKPGLKMIKINSDPKVYAVGEGGKLHWVTTEAVAVALYGTSWNKMIDDVPDGFFSNYKKSGAIEMMEDFSPSEEKANAISIDSDKGLQSPIIMRISDNEYDQTSTTIKAGRAVKFINTGVNKHTATANNLSWGTGTLKTNQHFTKYFTEAGTYQFFDSYYPDTMKGTLIVE